MGARYLIDTNTAIYYLNGVLDNKAAQMVEGGHALMSFITTIELLSWPEASDEEFQRLLNITAWLPNIGITDEIVNNTIAVRKEHGTKVPDAIIAATALSMNLELVSSNTRDFSKVKGLKLIDPLKHH